ncbi:MAG: hypothetical protein GX430_11425 [Treponema sp.]|nr:hypothetical protein [Treponema sp.]
MRWKDPPNPDLPVFASRFPLVTEYLEHAPDGIARFWFVLEADDWDALLGDTVRAYFQGVVFDSGPAAEAWILALEAEARLRNNEGEPAIRYVQKTFVLRWEGPVLVPSGHEPGPDQEYYVERIVARIEETLASGESLTWGTRFPGW